MKKKLKFKNKEILLRRNLTTLNFKVWENPTYLTFLYLHIL